ncbi:MULTISPECIES: hypothetical protein [unclassified Moorena]|nr:MULTISPECIES: hypothetical protein [unclassified Moorena]NEO18833.1 hypothetical protein [Moorena sp. SIO4A5]NEP21463.1 hypothetical protein [Moorena sp. SIO3I6]NEQ56825.1 hypothetical protein [Moorena sp. SIO4A1]
MRSLNLLVSIQLSAVSGQRSVVSGQPLAFGTSSSALAVRLQCDRLT